MTPQELDEISRGLEETGGSAFPQKIEYPDGSSLIEAGLTVRDWFAGQAIVGAAQPIQVLNTSMSEQDVALYVRRWAVAAYLLADAMLEARKR